MADDAVVGKMLAERERIARDLHDDAIQRLFGVGLALQTTRRRTRQPEVADRITAHLLELQRVVRDIRGTIANLSVDSGQSPENRLRTAVTDLTTDAPLHTEIRLSGHLEQLPEDVTRHAEYVVREAVSNAVRHSGATDLTVIVAITAADELAIEVTDNGGGIPPGAIRSGLSNLLQRAAELNGAFSTTTSDHGHGIRLTWTVPLITGPGSLDGGPVGGQRNSRNAVAGC